MTDLEKELENIFNTFYVIPAEDRRETVKEAVSKLLSLIARERKQLESTLQSYKQELEWFCEGCRIVHPAPKKDSFSFACEKCGKQMLMHYDLYKRRQLQKELDSYKSIAREMAWSLKKFTDPNECVFDHSGNCQEHGDTLDGTVECKNRVAKQALSNFKKLEKSNDK